MRKLLWKEWHEQSWKLGFGCLVLSALAWIGLRSRIIADETMVEWVCFIGFTLLPILSSTGLVPAERAEGSLESLLAMPISPWRILAAKTVMGMLLCAGPMAVAMVVSVLAAGGREMAENQMLTLYLRSALACSSLFIWMMALTIRLPSEARAALVAVGLLIIFTIATGAIVARVATQGDWTSATAWIHSLSPLSFVFWPSLYRPNSHRWETLTPNWPMIGLGQVLALGLLWIWSTSQLVKSVESRS